MVWPRRTDMPSFIQDGFKNSSSNEGQKEQPLFPDSYEALMVLYENGKKGLAFQCQGTHFGYRQIQHAYQKAFERAGLPYSATHVMRHGGCRNIFNEVPDTAVAQQLLGNSSMQTTLIYAKRHASALTKVAQSHWERQKIASGER